ncbi:MAG: cupin [Alphaproteobacteria bacterium]|nr:cupin [Alphaproteobacteria bacterium]
MSEQPKQALVAVEATAVPLRAKPPVHPEPFASPLLKRQKRALGDFFGLSNFGVNLTCLPPGGEASLLHRHSKQDEFVYVLEGTPTLVTDQGEAILAPGMCAGFAAGGSAHQIVNRSEADAVYLEVGDRTAGDEGVFPRDDLMAVLVEGKWVFARKDGRPY